MFKINWEKGDFAIRTTQGKDEKPYVELVKYDTDNDTGRRYCFVLAYFRRTSEDYSLVFVGDRPFDYMAKLDIGEIWHELWMTQLILNKQLEDENK